MYFMEPLEISPELFQSPCTIFKKRYQGRDVI